MNESDHIREEILRLMDAGQSNASIASEHPEWGEAIDDLETSVDSLEAYGNITPSEELLRKTLARIQTPIATPVRAFSFSFWKMTASAFVLVMVIAGGAATYQGMRQQGTSATGTIAMSDTSDDALSAQLDDIDSQLDQLDVDNGEADRALDYSTNPQMENF